MMAAASEDFAKNLGELQDYLSAFQNASEQMQGRLSSLTSSLQDMSDRASASAKHLVSAGGRVKCDERTVALLDRWAKLFERCSRCQNKLRSFSMEEDDPIVLTQLAHELSKISNEATIFPDGSNVEAAEVNTALVMTVRKVLTRLCDKVETLTTTSLNHIDLVALGEHPLSSFFVKSGCDSPEQSASLREKVSTLRSVLRSCREVDAAAQVVNSLGDISVKAVGGNGVAHFMSTFLSKSIPGLKLRLMKEFSSTNSHLKSFWLLFCAVFREKEPWACGPFEEIYEYVLIHASEAAIPGLSAGLRAKVTNSIIESIEASLERHTREDDTVHSNAVRCISLMSLLVAPDGPLYLESRALTASNEKGLLSQLSRAMQRQAGIIQVVATTVSQMSALPPMQLTSLLQDLLCVDDERRVLQNMYGLFLLSGLLLVLKGGRSSEDKVTHLWQSIQAVIQNDTSGVTATAKTRLLQTFEKAKSGNNIFHKCCEWPEHSQLVVKMFLE